MENILANAADETLPKEIPKEIEIQVFKTANKKLDDLLKHFSVC
jgi:hypothetical protein